MKSHRESKKTFSVLLDRDKAEAFEKKLREKNKTKSEWLNNKIDEEIGK